MWFYCILLASQWPQPRFGIALNKLRTTHASRIRSQALKTAKENVKKYRSIRRRTSRDAMWAKHAELGSIFQFIAWIRRIVQQINLNCGFHWSPHCNMMICPWNLGGWHWKLPIETLALSMSQGCSNIPQNRNTQKTGQWCPNGWLCGISFSSTPFDWTLYIYPWGAAQTITIFLFQRSCKWTPPSLLKRV